jgi:hypothetical protein
LPTGLIVDAKGFRNPDPVHELKILAGKAFAAGPEVASNLLYVVDGRVCASDVGLVARSGASIATPDRFSVAARRVARGEAGRTPRRTRSIETWGK